MLKPNVPFNLQNQFQIVSKVSFFERNYILHLDLQQKKKILRYFCRLWRCQTSEMLNEVVLNNFFVLVENLLFTGIQMFCLIIRESSLSNPFSTKMAIPDSQRHPKQLYSIQYKLDINVSILKTDYFQLWFLFKRHLHISILQENKNEQT